MSELDETMLNAVQAKQIIMSKIIRRATYFCSYSDFYAVQRKSVSENKNMQPFLLSFSCYNLLWLHGIEHCPVQLRQLQHSV